MIYKIGDLKNANILLIEIGEIYEKNKQFSKAEDIYLQGI